MNAADFINSNKSLKDIDMKERTADLCEAAIRKDGDEFEFVPTYLKTVRLTRLACGTQPKAYRNAPHGVRANYGLALFALRRGGTTIWDRIPEHIIDYELCISGIKGCGALLKLIPGKYKDFTLCRIAFQQGGASTKDVPIEYLGQPGFWDGVALLHIPPEYKTYEICMAQVRRCGNYLQYVPDDLKDILICMAAVAESPWAYRYVPERHFHSAFIQEAYQLARSSGAQDNFSELERKSA